VESFPWWGKAAVFGFASTSSGVVIGSLLGLVGATIGSEIRVAAATAAAIGGVFLSLMGLSGHQLKVLEIGRETPQQWLEHGPIYWAIVNGAALGIGGTSRIGFWLWYAIPVGALLLGHPLLSAVVFGVYGAARGFAAWVGLALDNPHRDIAGWLIGRYKVAHTLGMRYLLSMSVAGIFSIGL
jgi:hypothetical protein